ncbi:unnamed protein product, partial [Prunus brigantina]
KRKSVFFFERVIICFFRLSRKLFTLKFPGKIPSSVLIRCKMFHLSSTIFGPSLDKN